MTNSNYYYEIEDNRTETYGYDIANVSLWDEDGIPRSIKESYAEQFAYENVY
jgi:hypothetical protein